MTHSPHQNTPNPEDYIPSFRRRNLDTSGFMKKLGRFAGRLGKPVVRQLYALIISGNPNIHPNVQK